MTDKAKPLTNSELAWVRGWPAMSGWGDVDMDRWVERLLATLDAEKFAHGETLDKLDEVTSMLAAVSQKASQLQQSGTRVPQWFTCPLCSHRAFQGGPLDQARHNAEVHCVKVR